MIEIHKHKYKQIDRGKGRIKGFKCYQRVI